MQNVLAATPKLKFKGEPMKLNLKPLMKPEMQTELSSSETDLEDIYRHFPKSAVRPSRTSKDKAAKARSKLNKMFTAYDALPDDDEVGSELVATLTGENPEPLKYVYTQTACDEGAPIRVCESLVDLKHRPGLEPPFTAIVERKTGQGFAFEGFCTKDDVSSLVDNNILSSNVDATTLGLALAPIDVRQDMLEKTANEMLEK